MPVCVCLLLLFFFFEVLDLLLCPVPEGMIQHALRQELYYSIPPLY